MGWGGCGAGLTFIVCHVVVPNAVGVVRRAVHDEAPAPAPALPVRRLEREHFGVVPKHHFPDRSLNLLRQELLAVSPRVVEGVVGGDAALDL